MKILSRSACLLSAMAVIASTPAHASDGPNLVPVVFNGKKIPAWGQMFGAPQKFAVASSGGEAIELVLKNNSPSQDGELQLSDAAGNIVTTESVPPGENALKLKVPKAGVYFLEYSNGKAFWAIRFPEGISSVLCLEPGKPLSLSGGLLRRYFYVPKGTREILLAAECGYPKYALDVRNQDGEIVKSFDEKNPPAPVPVPDGMDGTVWCLDGVYFAAGHLSFDNIPNFIGSAPNGLLLPKALVDKDGL